MVGWHNRLNGHEFEQTRGDGEGQGSLACCISWGRKESDMTQQLNDNNYMYKYIFIIRRCMYTCKSKYHIVESESCSVMSDSQQPHGLQPARLLCPWSSPGQKTEVGSHSLLQGICPSQGLNQGHPYCGQILNQLSHQGSPVSTPKTELKDNFLREIISETKVKGWAPCFELREHLRFSLSGTYHPYIYGYCLCIHPYVLCMSYIRIKALGGLKL